MSDKKVKYFNKMYREFQTNLLKSLKKTNEKVYSVKRPEQLISFEKEIEENIELFNTKNDLLFDKVALLKRIFFGKPKLNQTNNKVAWKYIYLFYSISSGKNNSYEEKNESFGELSSLGLSNEQISGVMDELMNGKNEGLQNLVKDISCQFSGLKEDVKPQEIMNAIMNPGKENSMGIDFKKIIENTTKKISSGEIDISNIKFALDKK